MGEQWHELLVRGRTVSLHQNQDGELEVEGQDALAEMAAQILTGRHSPVAEVLAVLKEELAKSGRSLEEELALVRKTRLRREIARCQHPFSLALIAQYESAAVLEAVGKNPCTPGRVLERLARSSEEYGVYAAANPSLPRACWAELLRGVFVHGDQLVHRELTAEEQEAALTSANDHVVSAASSALWLRPDQLLRILPRLNGFDCHYLAIEGRLEVARLLWDHPADEVRRELSFREDADAELLGLLASDSEVTVRSGVATHPAASASVLERLAEDLEPDVRILVAKHKAAPERVLRQLASDPDPDVRIMITTRGWLSASVLRLLAEDESAEVRSSVAAHENCPPEVLAELAQDPEPMVRYEVAYNPRCSEQLRRVMRGDRELAL